MDEILFYIDQLNRLIIITESLFNDKKEFNYTTDDEKRFGLAVYAFLMKAHQTAKAIKLLLEKSIKQKRGFFEEIDILTRTMLEQAITIRYIKKDIPKRINLFLEHAFVAKKHLLNNAIKHKSKLNNDFIQETNNEYEIIKSKYPDKYNWAGKGINLKKMAKEVDMEWDYDFVYWLDCKDSHPDATVINKYASITENNEWEFLPEQSKERKLIIIKRIITKIANYYGIVLSIFAETHQIDIDNKFSEISENLVR